MLCEKCNKNPAIVHTVEIMNGVKHEHFLCQECADSMQFAIPIMMHILSGVTKRAPREEGPVCECGASFASFQQTGLLGCSKCYETFGTLLMPVIKRAQGGHTRHAGRRPEGAKKQYEKARLKDELQDAVREERYERAAELRDLIRELEGEA